MNKRGMTKSLLAKIVIAILVGIVVLIVFFMVAKGMKFEDASCRMKSSILSLVPSGTKWMLGGLTDCSATPEQIDGNDWSKCTEDIKKDYDACGKDESCRLDAQRECGAYQLAKLADRCYGRYGRNDFQGYVADRGGCGRYPCYSVEVLDTGKQTDLVARALKYLPGWTDKRLYFHEISGTDPLDQIFSLILGDTSNKVFIYYNDDRSADTDAVCVKGKK